MGGNRLSGATRLSPTHVTLIYVAVGGAWIILTDRLVTILVRDGALQQWVQTTKGWLFVAASALLIYGLVAVRERQLQRKNDQLERALRQSALLHRVLRHNLRNACNVIRGHTELLSERVDDERVDDESIETIRRNADLLVRMSDKASHLRNVTGRDAPTTAAVDLSGLVRSRVDAAAATHPDVRFSTDLPDAAWVDVVTSFGLVVDELVENAVEHNDRAEPSVWIAVRRDTADGTVRMDVADDGPGIPEMDEDVLEQGVETPLFHAQGLGLWLVRTFVVESGGSVRIVDNEPRGSVVRVTLPAATPPADRATGDR